ncbi:hypothetical protein [Rhodococcus sp. PvP104]|uniref:hypothetical protein n=1 Tax=Rhodococcus sp. PvP104 TaxID=2817911 RepID=UPI001AE12EF4|nr:hypothetical protein [Rhodococcus sp. PvP104]MBP2523607.1 hypothetical protein [Rhodococcus sp. PvP104]
MTSRNFDAAKSECAQFQREMDRYREFQGYAPTASFDRDRPAWSDSDHDAIDCYDGDVAQPSQSEWRSSPLTIPRSLQLAKLEEKTETWQLAYIAMNVSQQPEQSAPRISFERHGWGRDGEPIRAEHQWKYSLTVEEAVWMARGLLLLADLAAGTSDNIGEVA